MQATGQRWQVIFFTTKFFSSSSPLICSWKEHSPLW